MNEMLHSPESEPKTPSQEIAELLGGTYGEEFGFDNETVGELAELPFVEAFDAAYGYATQAGLDADEVLAPWIEPPAED